ncbi:hypothetical protein KEM52_002507 [Ascosphaera acerosa]|nr:hypothetical protein KEM52_002507 [Ascosphaera acerosa]
MLFILIFLALPAFCGRAGGVPLAETYAARPKNGLPYDRTWQAPLIDKRLVTATDEGAADPTPPPPLAADGNVSVFRGRIPGRKTLVNLLDALHTMQASYFEVWQGRWPSCNDWTAEVVSTQVAATLSALTAILSGRAQRSRGQLTRLDVIDGFAFENTLNYYFDHLAAFYFGEHTADLHHEAYDDMLWAVLNWLEVVKLQDLHSTLRYAVLSRSIDFDPAWHGMQMQGAVARRARSFYDAASHGWDRSLCGGGMIWNPRLEPYKNAITNQLYISASVAMYLYYSDDVALMAESVRPDQGIGADAELLDMPAHNASVAEAAPERDASMLEDDRELDGLVLRGPRDKRFLAAAIRGYRWLKESHMILKKSGLYADGYHVKGYKSPEHPGTGQCDVLNHAVFTYNQGVILSGLRGLWLGTGRDEYLQDGHELIRDVMRATGWPHTGSKVWKGLGRGGVMEDACDSDGTCSQDSQTFKSVFWHHFTEFCRPLYLNEESILLAQYPNITTDADDANALEERRARFMQHQRTCSAYLPWIRHNAQAALATRNEDGKFGMWWGRVYPDGTKFGKHALGNVTLEDASGYPATATTKDAHDAEMATPERHGVQQTQEVRSVPAAAPPDGHAVSETVLRYGAYGRGRGRNPRKKQPYRTKARLPPRALPERHELVQELDPSDTQAPQGAAPEMVRPGADEEEDDLEKEVHTWKEHDAPYRDVNDRGRGRTAETQAGGVAVLRALYVWESSPTLAQLEAVGKWGVS